MNKQKVSKMEHRWEEIWREIRRCKTRAGRKRWSSTSYLEKWWQTPRCVRFTRRLMRKCQKADEAYEMLTFFVWCYHPITWTDNYFLHVNCFAICSIQHTHNISTYYVCAIKFVLYEEKRKKKVYAAYEVTLNKGSWPHSYVWIWLIIVVFGHQFIGISLWFVLP